VKKGSAIGGAAVAGAMGLAIYAGLKQNGGASIPSSPVALPEVILPASPGLFRRWVCQGCFSGPGGRNLVCQSQDAGLSVCSMGPHIAVMHQPGSDCVDTNGQAKTKVGVELTFVSATCWHSDMDSDCDTDLMDYAMMQRVVTED
jgi:hypothetical protein